MHRLRPARIAVDCMGGDRAPEVVLEGIRLATRADEELLVVAVGPEETVTDLAESAERIEPLPASEVIGMDEHPVRAVRARSSATIPVCARAVARDRAAGWFTAGSTGAAMAAATLLVGRLDGIERPALAVVLPAQGRPVVLLDVGANADCRADHLLGFARMGAAYSRLVLDVDAPTVGLLNIGEESSKGSALAVETHELMSAHLSAFIGNIEGSDLPSGVADVVVTDGFTGNVALKLMEGATSTLLEGLRRGLTATPLRAAAAAVLRPALRELAAELDPDRYGGAPLLGVGGVTIVGHGSSSAQAVAAGIDVAARAVRRGLVDEIAESVSGEDADDSTSAARDG